MKSYFIVARLASKFKYRRCNKIFQFNNSLHRYIRINIYSKEVELEVEYKLLIATTDFVAYIIKSTTNNVVAIDKISLISNIIYFLSIDQPIKNYAFREFHYVTAMIQLFFLNLLYNLCFNIKYIISLINKTFLSENYSTTEIKKISTSITIKGINSNKHEISEYIKIKMYLSNKNKIIVLIEREFYIIDNLTTKTLIEIDIIKSKEIVLDLQANIIRIDIY